VASVVLISAGSSLFAGLVLFMLVNGVIASFLEGQASDRRRHELLVSLRLRGTGDRARALVELKDAGAFVDRSLEGGQLDGCDFSTEDLTSARLARCSAIGALFVDTVMVRADLTAAVLVRADFTRANLTGCDLSNSTIDLEALKHASMCWGAILPNGQLYRGEFKLLGDEKYAEAQGFDMTDHQQRNDFYQLGASFRRAGVIASD
jgi:uncharacterized protein YjbI with pentapeptide repeats